MQGTGLAAAHSPADRCAPDLTCHQERRELSFLTPSLDFWRAPQRGAGSNRGLRRGERQRLPPSAFSAARVTGGWWHIQPRHLLCAWAPIPQPGGARPCGCRHHGSTRDPLMLARGLPDAVTGRFAILFPLSQEACGGTALV